MKDRKYSLLVAFNGLEGIVWDLNDQICLVQRKLCQGKILIAFYVLV